MANGQGEQLGVANDPTAGAGCTDGIFENSKAVAAEGGHVDTIQQDEEHARPVARTPRLTPVRAALALHAAG